MIFSSIFHAINGVVLKYPVVVKIRIFPINVWRLAKEMIYTDKKKSKPSVSQCHYFHVSCNNIFNRLNIHFSFDIGNCGTWVITVWNCLIRKHCRQLIFYQNICVLKEELKKHPFRATLFHILMIIWIYFLFFWKNIMVEVFCCSIHNIIKVNDLISI